MTHAQATMNACVHCGRSLDVPLAATEGDEIRCPCGKANSVRVDDAGEAAEAYFADCDDNACEVCDGHEDAVAAAVRIAVAEYLDPLPPDDADLRTAGLDSLAMLDLVLAAEESGVTLPDDAHERVRTIADLVAMVEQARGPLFVEGPAVAASGEG